MNLFKYSYKSNIVNTKIMCYTYKVINTWRCIMNKTVIKVVTIILLLAMVGSSVFAIISYFM